MGDSRSSLSWCNRCKKFFSEPACSCKKFTVYVGGEEDQFIYAKDHKSAVIALAEKTPITAEDSFAVPAFNGKLARVFGEDGSMKMFRASVSMVVSARAEEV